MKKIRRFIKKEQLLGISSSIMAIVVGLMVGYVILLMSNPSQAWNGFRTILLGGFAGGTRGIGNVFYYAVPIMMAGVGVAFAFRTGIFNIGGPGQFIVGSYMAVLIAIKCTYLPGVLHWIIPLIAAMIAGALWGLIPGILNAFFKVNIVISTIMMNYIGMYVVNQLIRNSIYDSGKSQTLPLPVAATLPKLGLDKLFPGSSINSGIIISIAIVIVVHILLNKTALGYELKACGFNREASKYAGINEKRNILLVMMISGALVALGGGLMYLSGAGKSILVVDALAPEGFTAISVALLGLNSPIGVIFSALFIAYIKVGGFYMQAYRFVPEIIDIIIASIIYFSAFSLIIKDLISKAILRNKKAEDGEAK